MDTASDDARLGDLLVIDLHGECGVAVASSTGRAHIPGVGRANVEVPGNLKSSGDAGIGIDSIPVLDRPDSLRDNGHMLSQFSSQHGKSIER